MICQVTSFCMAFYDATMPRRGYPSIDFFLMAGQNGRGCSNYMLPIAAPGATNRGMRNLRVGEPVDHMVLSHLIAAIAKNEYQF